MKQLTLEDVVGSFDYKATSTSEKFLNHQQSSEISKGTPFDKKKAHVKNKPGGKGVTDVRVMIPMDAKCSEELTSKEKIDSKFDMFMEYTTAIWRYKRAENKGFSWDEAEELFKRYRDSQKTIAIRILLEDEFEPQFVIKYLR